jgi:hypothetical protein
MEDDVIENENPALRSYCVSVFRPKSTIDRRESHHSDLDDLTRREQSQLDWKSKNITIGHGKTDGYEMSIPAIVSGKIIKTALDSEGNVIGLHLNYGNKYGLAASNRIKKRETTDVSSVISVLYDGISNKYEAVDVGLVKEGRLPGTHLLYTKGHDFEYVRDPKYFKDPVVEQLMKDAQELNRLRAKNIEKQNTKSLDANTIASIKSVPRRIVQNMATPIKEPSTPTTPTTPAVAATNADTTKDVAMTDAEQPTTPATPGAAPKAQNPIMEEADYKKAQEEHANIEKALLDNPDSVEEAAKLKLLMLERQLGNHEKAIQEKQIQDLIARVTQSESNYNNLLQKVQVDNKTLLDKDEELLNNLFQTPQGQQSLQSYGYTPEQIAGYNKLLYEHLRKADPAVQEAASALIPITVCSASSNAELINNLQSQLHNSKAKQSAMQKQMLIQTLKNEPRHHPYARPATQTRPPVSSAPPAQHSRFINVPATPAQYSKPAEQAAPTTEENSPYKMLETMRKSNISNYQDRTEFLQRKFPPTPRKNLPTEFPKYSDAKKGPAN